MPALDRLVAFASDPIHAASIAQTKSYLRCTKIEAILVELMAETLDVVEEDFTEMTPDDVEMWMHDEEDE